MSNLPPSAVARQKDPLPDGPWSKEPDHVEFEHAGFPCILNRSRMGNWCGYMAVPPGHPWHGKGYDDVPLEAHGGLTYASACHGDVCHVPKPGEPDDVWWFGFDCGHSMDLVPGMLSYGLGFYDGCVYRDQAYVTDECRRMAWQAMVAGKA